MVPPATSPEVRETYFVFYAFILSNSSLNLMLLYYTLRLLPSLYVCVRYFFGCRFKNWMFFVSVDFLSFLLDFCLYYLLLDIRKFFIWTVSKNILLLFRMENYNIQYWISSVSMQKVKNKFSGIKIHCLERNVCRFCGSIHYTLPTLYRTNHRRNIFKYYKFDVRQCSCGMLIMKWFSTECHVSIGHTSITCTHVW